MSKTKIVYLCDRKKECNKHMACGLDCKHTTDIRHAVNFISLGDGIYFEERLERKIGRWIETDEITDARFAVLAKWRTETPTGTARTAGRGWIKMSDTISKQAAIDALENTKEVAR